MQQEILQDDMQAILTHAGRDYYMFELPCGHAVVVSCLEGAEPARPGPGDCEYCQTIKIQTGVTLHGRFVR